MALYFLEIPEWGDGQAPPAFYIKVPGIGVNFKVMMPPLLKAVIPEIETPGPVKTARYTGNIHKAIRGVSWSATFDWILFANRKAKDELQTPLSPTITYLDVISAIIQADMAMDYDPEHVEMYMKVHGGIPEFGGDDYSYVWKFRLDGNVKRKAIHDKNVIEQVSLSIITDGWCRIMPIHMAVPPLI